MSLREVDIAMRKICKRTTNNFARKMNLEAAIRGIKLNVPIIDGEPSEPALKPEDEKTHDDHLKKVQERKLEEKRRGR